MSIFRTMLKNNVRQQCGQHSVKNTQILSAIDNCLANVCIENNVKVVKWNAKCVLCERTLRISNLATCRMQQQSGMYYIISLKNYTNWDTVNVFCSIVLAIKHQPQEINVNVQ